jgi:hypothetical protein
MTAAEAATLKQTYVWMKAVQAQLALLSVAPTQAMTPSTSKRVRQTAPPGKEALYRLLGDSTKTRTGRHGESAPPPGALDQAPPLDLAAKYAVKFERAKGDLAKIRRLCFMAEKDIERYRGTTTRTVHEDHADAVRELLEDHEGDSAADAAYVLDTGVRWVKRHRALNGRDPETGLPARLTDRKRRIIELANAGTKQTEIAAEVGCNQSYVSQVVNGY